MSTTSYFKAIESRFDTLWANKTPIAYDNVPFLPLAAPEPWVKVEVFDGAVRRASVGLTYLERSHGMVFFTIYVPKNTGTEVVRGYADDIIDMFRSYESSVDGGTLLFTDIKLKRIGETYHSGAGSSVSSTVASTQWYTMVVSIGFIFNKVVSVVN